MTVTIRIQYKGEGARKLLAEEHNQDRDVAQRYADDMNRALSLFAIPHPPDSSRVIWKSGFVLCNYNTSRDTPFFDRIYRGVFRAQSIACKATLDGLHISYIHLFENSKPVFFGKQSQQAQHQPDTTNLLPRSHHTARPRSRSPPRDHYHKPYTRPLGPERSAPELSRSAPARDATHRDYHHHATNGKVYVKAEPVEVALPSGQPASLGSTASNGAAVPSDISEALKKLAESHTLLSILGQTPTPSSASTEHPPNQELSSTWHEPPRAPRSLVSSSSHEERHEYSSRRPLSPPPRSNGTGYHSRDDRSSRPPTLEDRYHSSSRSFNNHSNVRAYSPTPRRGRSISPGGDRRVPYEPRHAGYETNPKYGTNYSQKKWYNRSRSPYQRRPYNGDKVDAPPYSKGPLKRPLSPTLTPGRAGSPPAKRRYSINNLAGLTQGSPAEVNGAATRPSSANAGYERASSAQAMRGPIPSSAQVPTSTSSVSGLGVNGADSAQPISASQQITTLNRDLWDVRRQITAMKAREDSILSDLKTLRAPEPVEPRDAPAKVATPEDRLKLLEAEINSLRSRLQSETVRRQLVEEACENERRRRKHAEDLLDDARRESSVPIVVPAMMDAFERLAQLTGETLMSASEQEPSSAKVW